MRQICYPTLAEVIAVHDDVLQRFGDAPKPLRDEGLLESALMRPQMAAWYEEADLIRPPCSRSASHKRKRSSMATNEPRSPHSTPFFGSTNGSTSASHSPWPNSSNTSPSVQPIHLATDAFEAWLRQNVQPGTSNE